MVICLERCADLHMAHMPLTVSCFSKIQIAFTFLVPAHPGSPGKRAAKCMCVCVVFSRIIVVIIRVWPNSNVPVFGTALGEIKYVSGGYRRREQRWLSGADSSIV